MWKWLEFVLFLTVLCAVWGDDFDVQESPQETYDLGEADREGWRALNTFQDDDTVWIPRDLPQEPFEGHVQKRRRLRKRKRRPTTESSIIDDLNSGEVLPERVPSGGRRKILPQRLEPDVDSWKEMDEDVVAKPNIRRRVTPDFQPSEELMDESDITPIDTGIRFEETVEEKEKQVFKSDENNEEGASKTDEKEFRTTQKTIISDLKTVLKQAGTGSLSEILQQKNLSLSELLMGNQRAIYALTETPQEVTEASTDVQTSEVADTTKYKRLPPSIGLRKNINRNFEQEQDSFEELSTKKLLEAQRKRLSLLGHKDNRLFSTVTKYDVITEPSTERRIFVPSHPKYYTTQDFKPKFNIYDAPTTKIIQEASTTTTSTTPKIEATSTLYPKPLLKNLPLTNAKINKLTSKLTFKVEKKNEEEEEEEEENYPIAFKFPTPIPIDIQEVAGFKHKPEHLADTRKADAPIKMSIDLDLFTEKTTETPNYPSEVSKTTTELTGEKVIPATAKDEIMEIMKDPISRERLSRILESRNMTVKELVEQRERGSSQVHLADIFHNKTREPEPKEEPFVGTINTEYFNSFPLFGRQQKSRNFGAEPSYGHLPVVSPSTTAPTVKTTEKTTKPTFTVTSFPAIKIGIENTKDQTQPFPGSKFESDLQPPIPQSNNKDKINKPLQNLEEAAQENYSQDDLQRFEHVDSTESLASNVKINENNSIQEDEEVLINIPSGVKSAIFVSLAIICFSILVFLTILLVFKWTQRQSKRINYCNSLSTRVKSPIILQRRPTTTIKSFMNETLGRKKNYYQSNIQSTDELWECGRERIPSF